MNYTCTEGEEKVPDDELEYKIWYQRFTVHSKPKILDCLHRICARCLNKILHIGDGSPSVSCPFCRHETELREVEGLPDDTNVMSKLILKDKTAWNSDCKEVVLTPKNGASSSSSHVSSNCLVIIIMEVQRGSPRTPSQSTASDDYADHGTESVSLSSQPAGPRSLLKAVQACTQNTGMAAWISLLWFPPSWDLFTSDSESARRCCVYEFCSLQSNCVSCMASASASAMEFVTALHEADTQCFINW